MIVPWPEPIVTRAPGPADPDLPLHALLIGGAVPALVASAAWWLGIPYVAIVAAIGVPIGAVFAIVATSRLAGPRWLATSAVLGLAAPLVPGLLIAAGMLCAGLAAVGESGAQALASGAAVAALALIVALVAGVPLTVPMAVVVGYLVHRAAAMGPERAGRHVGVLGIAALLVALPTLAFAVARG